MRTKDIPEEEKSKLRLFKKLPKGLRGAAAFIRDSAPNWSNVKRGVTAIISDEIYDLQAKIAELRGLRTLFNSTKPVGEQRTNSMPVSPERRKSDLNG